MPDFAPVFAALHKVMAPYAAKLDTKKDDETELYVDTRHLQKNKKPLFFGAVQVKKSYVSFHLMPVYLKPELLASASPELKSHMQGKSCFNFSLVDPKLIKELAALTKAGFASYQEQGFCVAAQPKLVDGALCDVIAGTHQGKAGTVHDIKTGKSGQVSITVLQANGVRFKTLAKSVVLKS